MAKATPTLTKRQKQIYDFVRKGQSNGSPPTVREIGEKFGIRSPNGVACHLKALEKKGFLARTSSKSRSLEVKTPTSVQSILSAISKASNGNDTPITVALTKKMVKTANVLAGK